MATKKLTDKQLRLNSGLFIHENLYLKEINDLKTRIENLEKNP